MASVLDEAAVRAALREHRVTGVVQPGGEEGGGESVADPLLYYRENVIGFERLLRVMRGEGVHRILFPLSPGV